MNLSDDLRTEIRLLIEDPKNGTSNRIRDRRRSKLKALGLIWFNRKTWAWEVSADARVAERKGEAA